MVLIRCLVVLILQRRDLKRPLLVLRCWNARVMIDSLIEHNHTQRQTLTATDIRSATIEMLLLCLPLHQSLTHSASLGPEIPSRSAEFTIRVPSDRTLSRGIVTICMDLMHKGFLLSKDSRPLVVALLCIPGIQRDDALTQFMIKWLRSRPISRVKLLSRRQIVRFFSNIIRFFGLANT
jgi:hypothetical protein